jgi:hypothetical protein
LAPFSLDRLCRAVPVGAFDGAINPLEQAACVRFGAVQIRLDCHAHVLVSHLAHQIIEIDGLVGVRCIFDVDPNEGVVGPGAGQDPLQVTRAQVLVQAETDLCQLDGNIGASTVI